MSKRKYLLAAILMLLTIFLTACSQKPHEHQYEQVVTPPTCLDAGYTTFTCSCGDTYTGNEVAATGHTWGEGEVIQQATCLQVEITQRACACGELQQEKGESAEHAYGADGICPVCKAKEALAYKLSEDGTYYSVTGIGTWQNPEVIIPAQYEGLPVKKIAQEAFAENTTIRTVAISEGVTVIGGFAFQGCTELTSVTIPSTVIDIGREEGGGGTFLGCTKLQDIQLPKGLTEIVGGTFADCGSLTELVIPQGVKEIGNDAFGSCESLKTITLPDTVTKLGFESLGGCNNLTEIRYQGTMAQWEKIHKLITDDGERAWDAMTENYTICCTDGQITK